MAKPGDELGGWVLEEKLGEGGNGVVWRARYPDRDEAALKILKDTRPEKVPFKRFAREVATVRGLGERPGILPVIDAHVPESPGRKELVWYAMPLADAIEEILSEAPVQDIVAAVHRLAVVLSELLRDHGLAHRDLKPSNLYRWRDEYVIGDFGLVDLPGSERLTETGRVPGAFGYIADEVMQDPAGADGPPADVYALAKTLWVLLNPDALFPPGGSLDEADNPSSLRRIIVDTRAAELDGILAAATRHVDNRISMADFADDLGAWLSVPAVIKADEGLDSAIARAKHAMKGTQTVRDAAEQRQADFRSAREALRERVEPVFSALRSIDSGVDTGPLAIGNLQLTIEQPNEMGRPIIEETAHQAARLAKDDDLNLVVGFSLQLAESGDIYVDGIVFCGDDQVLGGALEQTHLGVTTARAGSVELIRALDAAVADVMAALPAAIEAFAEAS
jgi:hypothetical protein